MSAPAAEKYQPHVDGLRAIAVLAVIVFHARNAWLPGGFYGVDVFFVISGYLITGNIASQVQAGRFTYLDFYQRRARRILPALLLVLLASCVAAFFILTPAQLKDFEHSALANLVFASNVLFAIQTDYFSAPAEQKPLIHTWSLAVEEQFYLLYPTLLLFLLRRLKAPPVVAARVIAALCVLSLLAGLALKGHHASPVFYLMPTRIWELGAGALAALLTATPATRVSRAVQRQGTPLFALGLLLIGVSLTQSEVFPGPWSACAVLGAALVILAGRFTPLSALLANRPAVLVGLASYSLYLWHQPVFAFLRAYLPNSPTDAQYVLAVLVTLALGWLSWRFVETPFRNRKKVSVPVLLGSLGAVAALVGAFSLLAQFKDGLPGRLNTQARAALSAAGNGNPRGEECSSTLNHPRALQDGCVYPDPHGKADVLLAGDSHAGAVAYSIGEALKGGGHNVKTLLLYGCAPLGQDFPSFNPQERQCTQHQRDVLKFIQNSDAHTIILFNRWSSYFAGPYRNPLGGIEPADGPGNFYRSGVNGAAMTAAYLKQIQAILNTGKTVILVYPVPDMGWNVPTTLYKNAQFGFRTDVKARLSDYQARNAQVIAAFDALQAPNLRRVRPADFLCRAENGQTCTPTLNGRVAYFDDDHLNLTGADELAKRIAAQLPH